jgi:hypothetical protein
LGEFGPYSLIYHEGSQYRVIRALLSVSADDQVATGAQLATEYARICPVCGYGHFRSQRDVDCCVACAAPLADAREIRHLYRIENVSTRRAERITANEEERVRQGYEMQTTLQFAESDGKLQTVKSIVADAQGPILELQYGPAANALRTRLESGSSITDADTEISLAALEKDVQERVWDGSDDHLSTTDIEPAGHTEDSERLNALIAATEKLIGPRNDPKLARLIDNLGELLKAGFLPMVFCRYIATAHYVAAPPPSWARHWNPGASITSCTQRTCRRSCGNGSPAKDLPAHCGWISTSCPRPARCSSIAPIRWCPCWPTTSWKRPWTRSPAISTRPTG